MDRVSLGILVAFFALGCGIVSLLLAHYRIKGTLEVPEAWKQGVEVELKATREVVQAQIDEANRIFGLTESHLGRIARLKREVGGRIPKEAQEALAGAQIASSEPKPLAFLFDQSIPREQVAAMLRAAKGEKARLT